MSQKKSDTGAVLDEVMEPTGSLSQQIVDGFRHRHVRDHRTIRGRDCRVLEIQHTAVCERLVFSIIRSLNNEIPRPCKISIPKSNCPRYNRPLTAI